MTENWQPTTDHSTAENRQRRCPRHRSPTTRTSPLRFVTALWRLAPARVISEESAPHPRPRRQLVTTFTPPVPTTDVTLPAAPRLAGRAWSGAVRRGLLYVGLWTLVAIFTTQQQ